MRNRKDICFRNKYKMISKKAQEEIVGFVLIIVIVAVIGLVFLGVFFRQNQELERHDSIDLTEFLESSIQFNSECTEQYSADHKSVGDLIRLCYRGALCDSGEEACKVLNRTYAQMINTSFPVGENWPDKGYEFSISYGKNISKKELVNLMKGNCSSSYRSENYPFQDVEIKIKLCT